MVSKDEIDDLRNLMDDIDSTFRLASSSSSSSRTETSPKPPPPARKIGVENFRPHAANSRSIFGDDEEDSVAGTEEDGIKVLKSLEASFNDSDYATLVSDNRRLRDRVSAFSSLLHDRNEEVEAIRQEATTRVRAVVSGSLAFAASDVSARGLRFDRMVESGAATQLEGGTNLTPGRSHSASGGHPSPQSAVPVPLQSQQVPDSAPADYFFSSSTLGEAIALLEAMGFHTDRVRRVVARCEREMEGEVAAVAAVAAAEGHLPDLPNPSARSFRDSRAITGTGCGSNSDLSGGGGGIRLDSLSSLLPGDSPSAADAGVLLQRLLRRSLDELLREEALERGGPAAAVNAAVRASTPAVLPAPAQHSSVEASALAVTAAARAAVAAEAAELWGIEGDGRLACPIETDVDSAVSSLRFGAPRRSSGPAGWSSGGAPPLPLPLPHRVLTKLRDRREELAAAAVATEVAEAVEREREIERGRALLFGGDDAPAAGVHAPGGGGISLVTPSLPAWGTRGLNLGSGGATAFASSSSTLASTASKPEAIAATGGGGRKDGSSRGHMSVSASQFRFLLEGGDGSERGSNMPDNSSSSGSISAGRRHSIGADGSGAALLFAGIKDVVSADAVASPRLAFAPVPGGGSGGGRNNTPSTAGDLADRGTRSGRDGVGGFSQKAVSAIPAAPLYEGFLEKIQQPECHDLKQHLLRFVLSVLGPESPSGDYEFYGLKNVERRTSDFLFYMSELVVKHPAWQPWLLPPSARRGRSSVSLSRNNSSSALPGPQHSGVSTGSPDGSGRVLDATFGGSIAATAGGGGGASAVGLAVANSTKRSVFDDSAWMDIAPVPAVQPGVAATAAAERVHRAEAAMAAAAEVEEEPELEESVALDVRNGLEQFVMERLEPVVMGLHPDEAARDALLLRTTRILSKFVLPEHLDINEAVRNELVLSVAAEELRRISAWRCPGGKIGAVLRSSGVIFSVLNLARGVEGGGTSKPGADDFLPVFIFVVLRAQVSSLCSQCDYIASFRNPDDLMSKAGYCFVNLRSAIEFLLAVPTDPSLLSIAPEEFSA